MNVRMEVDSLNSLTIPHRVREYLFKILIIGDISSGKTSFISRYVHKNFKQNYSATIGLDFALKVIKCQNQVVRVQLWDIAGQERFGTMTRVYYKEAVGAFVVFDLTRPQSLEATIKWKNDLDLKVNLPDRTNIPCVLLANKCDLRRENNPYTPEFLDKFCAEHGFFAWFYTSAKENIGIENAGDHLVSTILQKQNTFENTLENHTLSLNKTYDHIDDYDKSRSGCVC